MSGTPAACSDIEIDALPRDADSNLPSVDGILPVCPCAPMQEADARKRK